MARPRVLFVDDEASIRLTMPAILEMHQFEVTACATVAEALASMQSHSYDVLIADLNIGQPGDGFTVVSAMRRTQPNAVTIILTGYPAFETALKAIRSQVDDYLVKPANVAELVKLINDKLLNNKPTHQIKVKSVSTILAENKQAILNEWLTRLRDLPEIAKQSLSQTELLNHTPSLIDELIRILAPGASRASANGATLTDAAQHGRVRLQQGLSIPFMIDETRILREVTCLTINQHLLSVDISRVFTDMVLISRTLDHQAKIAVEAYLDPELKAA